MAAVFGALERFQPASDGTDKLAGGRWRASERRLSGEQVNELIRSRPQTRRAPQGRREISDATPSSGGGGAAKQRPLNQIDARPLSRSPAQRRESPVMARRSAAGIRAARSARRALFTSVRPPFVINHLADVSLLSAPIEYQALSLEALFGGARRERPGRIQFGAIRSRARGPQQPI